MILNPIDQGIRDQGFNFVPFNQYLASPFQIPNTENTGDARVSAGLPTIYQSQAGGGGGGALQADDPMTNFDNFYDYTGNKYFMSKDRPNLDSYSDNIQKTFMGFPSYRQQELTGADLGEYIGSGTDTPLELTRAGKIQESLRGIKEGIGSFAEKVGGIGPISMILGSMDRFDTLPKLDQEFIKANMGYTGPTVFGENTSGLSKDPFGRNVRSAFGNYAEKVREDFTNLGTALSPTGKIGGKSAYQGATFNPETGLFESDDQDLADYANRMTKMVRSKYMFDKKAIAQQKFNEKIAENNRKVAALREKKFAAEGRSDPNDPSRQGASGRRPGSGGTVDRVTSGPGRNVDDTGQAYDSGGREGFGYGLADGGIVDMLEIYD